MSTTNPDLMFVARFCVEQYRDQGDALIVAHQHAMDCRDCEEFLQLGIDAFDWLSKSESLMRDASYQGKLDFTAELRDTFDSLYAIWLAAAPKADEWIKQVAERGFNPDNLARFEELRVQVEHECQVREWQKLGRAARATDTEAAHAV